METVNMLVGIGVLIAAIMTIGVSVMLYFLKGYRQDQQSAEKNRSQVWHKLSELEADVLLLNGNYEHIKDDIDEIKTLMRDKSERGK